MPTFGSLFSGFGGADIGLVQAGFTPKWAIELDPDIAEVYRVNHGEHIICSSITDICPRTLPPVDLLWLSPPCQAHSIARSSKLPARQDAEIGFACIPYIEAIAPRWVCLENVEGYKRSPSFQAIVNCLYSLGYWVNYQVVNAADHGVPQTRRRLILMAVKNGFVSSLPEPQQWKGWHEAIADLIPSFQEIPLPPWIATRLNPEKLGNSFLVDGIGNSNCTKITARLADQPAMTITAHGHTKGPYRIVLAEMMHSIRPATIRKKHESSPTVSSEWLRRPSSSPRVLLLPTTTALALSPRALARLQTFPDNFTLPVKRKLASKGIGNAVPPLLAKTMGQTLIHQGA